MALPLRRRQPDTVRVATRDVQHSNRRSAVVVGPVELPSLDVLIARFASMAAVGPVARVGLQPSTTSTRWRFSTDSVGEAVHAVARIPDADPVTLLSTLRQRPVEGVRVLSSGDYLAIDFSHGLGEVPLLEMLVAVLLGDVDPADPTVWAPYESSVPPLLTAVVRALGLGPQRLWPLWRQHRRNARAPAEAIAVRTVDTGPSPATRATQISAATVAELRSHRDSAMPGVSLFALCTYALHEAFADAGFDIDRTVTLPFDVRGYLPKGRATLGSFSAGLDFALDDASGPRDLQHHMSAASRMARPVANLAIGTLKARAAMRSGVTAEWAAPAHPRMHLLHSSVGKVPRAGWSFSDPSEARILIASDPAGPCGMTVTTSTVLDALWMTAAFHDSIFDAKHVSEALNSVATRVHSLIDAPSKHA